jgi:hypothetical protein
MAMVAVLSTFLFAMAGALAIGVILITLHGHQDEIRKLRLTVAELKIEDLEQPSAKSVGGLRTSGDYRLLIGARRAVRSARLSSAFALPPSLAA